MSLDADLAMAVANHWISRNWPTFHGPKLSGFPGPSPEIEGWHVSRTVPLYIDLTDFKSLEQFAPCLRCVIGYLDKLLRSTFEHLAESHDIAAIEFTCSNAVDIKTNAFILDHLMVNGRLLAKPKEKAQ